MVILSFHIWRELMVLFHSSDIFMNRDILCACTNFMAVDVFNFFILRSFGLMDIIMVSIVHLSVCLLACLPFKSTLSLYTIYNGTCIMKLGKSHEKHINFIICLAWSLQNHA